MAELSFSKEDFVDLKIDEIVRQVDLKDQLGYSKVLRAAIATCADEKQKKLLRFLEMLATTSLRIDHPDNPYGIVDNLDPELLTFFSEIVHEFSDPEIKSKISDVLWLRTKDYKMAQLAIDSYLSSAKLFEDFDHWTRTQRRLERAMQLAERLGKKNEKYSTVITAITELLDRCNAEDPLFLSAELMRLLQERREGDAAKYATFAEKLAVSAEGREHFELARKYWETKANWHHQLKDEEEARNARLRYAECYEKESDFNFANRKPPFMMACYPLEQAILAYRRAQDSERKIEELKLKLRDYQSKAVEEMFPIYSDAVDISEIVVETEKAIASKDFITALSTLAFLHRPSNR